MNCSTSFVDFVVMYVSNNKVTRFSVFIWVSIMDHSTFLVIINASPHLPSNLTVIGKTS